VCAKRRVEMSTISSSSNPYRPDPPRLRSHGPPTDALHGEVQGTPSVAPPGLETRDCDVQGQALHYVIVGRHRASRSREIRSEMLVARAYPERYPGLPGGAALITHRHVFGVMLQRDPGLTTGWAHDGSEISISFAKREGAGGIKGSHTLREYLKSMGPLGGINTAQQAQALGGGSPF
jgi:hypothetical protein